MTDILNKHSMPLALIAAALIIGGAIVFATMNSQEGTESEKLGNLSEVVQPETQGPEEEAGGESPAGDLEALAKCLTEKGAKFYGAYWCGWCNRQKESFGEAAQYLPYVECSDEATQQMTEVCQAEGISGFPTWEFDGKKQSGFKEPQVLAELSGCPF
ncbi:MAG: protein disulfide isomerase family protein [bacterium]